MNLVYFISPFITSSESNREYLIGNGIVGHLVSLLLLATNNVNIPSTMKEELIINCLRALETYVFGEGTFVSLQI